jgi:hypothetical protein
MRAIAAATAFVALSACSSYQAVKLDRAGTIGPKEKGGVPVVLPKPEFVVKKVEGSDPDQYQVSIRYVPDPDQRYAVRLASTPLAQIDLSMALNESGSLTSTSAEVKDQVAPTALALFKVAASSAALFGTGGLLALDNPQSISDCFKPAKGPATAWRATCVFKFVSGGDCARIDQRGVRVGDALSARLAPYVDEKHLDKGAPMASLFARDAKEAACFAQASAAMAAVTGKKPDELAAGFEDAFNSANSDGKTQADVTKAIVDRVKAAIGSGDSAALKRIYYVADAAGVSAVADPAALARFRSLLGNETATAADAAKLQTVMNGQGLAAGTPNVGSLNIVEQIGLVVAERKAFDAVATLSLAAWKSRYMTNLQKELADHQHDALAKAPGVDPEDDAAVITTRRTMATLAGVRPEYERLREFNRLLNRVPGSASGQRLSPAIEYQEVSKEAAALELAMNTAIAATLTGDAKAKPPAPLPLRTPWVSADCIAASAKEQWRYTTGADTPEFVVVLRRDDGVNLEPSAREKPLCGTQPE